MAGVTVATGVSAFDPTINTTAPFTITPSGSPYTYLNSTLTSVAVFVSGGTVSKLEYKRGSASPITIGLTSGMFLLTIGDSLIVTYSVVPTMSGIYQ